MSFAALAGGSSCGPSNPLAQLSKTYSSDRGAQHDHFNPASSSGFRHPSPNQRPSTPADAQAFFHNPQQAFDLQPLAQHLPSQHFQQPPDWAQAFVADGGAVELRPSEHEAFGRAFGAPQLLGVEQWSGEFGGQQLQQRVGSQRSSFAPRGQARMFGQGMGMGRGMGMGMQEVRQEVVQHQPVVDWETAFLAQEVSRIEEVVEQPVERAASPMMDDSMARDALAQTAGALLDTVRTVEGQRSTEGTTSDKFANSTFLDLMRKLRDGEVAVEGDKVVEQIGPSRGKGKERASGWSNEFGREEEGRAGARFGGGVGMSARELMNGGGLASVGRQNGAMSEAQREFVKEREEGYAEMSDVWADEDDIRSARERTTNRRHVQFSGDGGAGLEMEHEEMRMDTSVPLASEFWDDDFDAAMISGGHAANVPKSKEADLSAQQKEWDTLQNDWDNFEATATGIQPVASTSSAFNGYTFAQNNPYVQSSTRTHELHHTPRTTYDSILEKEAAVQQNPRDSQAWLALGIKQQENEREEMAIRALRRALELDPGMGEAYLALAVSYTNENERSLSYEAIDKWINSLAVERYPREVEHYRDLFGPMPESGMAERSNYLTGLLIRLAQSSAERDGADVDADVQIGLGVLFNTSEEYDKAGDCFESALSVRPDDPLLFNRLGATLANSGKTELAIQYYLEALEIQPAYVRARFNLAVANMNLSQYSEAVEHLLTALSIQDADSQLQQGGPPGPDSTNGVTSQTLWDSLNIALLMMQRSDLAAFTSDRNLNAFRSEFPNVF